MGEVTDLESFNGFICKEISNTLIHTDLPLFREAYNCLMEGTYQEIEELDRLATALRPTIEARQAGEKTGRQTWKLYGQMFGAGTPRQNLYARCSEFLPCYQAVVVFGLLAGILEIPREAALFAYCQQVVGNFAQACIKLIGLGPTGVQKVIHDLSPAMNDWVREGLDVPIESAGSISPRWDIASSRHAYAEQRLYIS